MNSPAVHSFSGGDITKESLALREKSDGLKDRVLEMESWREKLVFLMRNKRILQWMDFDINEYADIVFAAQIGNIHINYNEETFDNGKNSVFDEQKKSSLGDFDTFMSMLGNAKDTFQTQSEKTLSLLDETINITQMIRISSPKSVVREVQESDMNYHILREQCKNIFDAGKILIDANKRLSSLSLHTIANLYNIRFFKNSRISRAPLNTFYRSEEVRLFLTGKPGQPKESPIAGYQRSLEELREKIRDFDGRIDALKRDTNFVICHEILGPKYIETIAEQAKMVGEILRKYEKKIWKQEDILRKFNRMVESVDFSKDLLQVFVSVEQISKEYGKNISLLSDGYNVIKGLEDMEDIIRKLKLLCVRIKDGLMEKLGREYQNNPRFDLNPAISVSEAIGNTRKNRGPLQKIYHALVRLVLEKDVFNEKLMIDIVASHDKTVSIDWQNKYKVSLYKSAEAKLFEYQKHPFYSEMVETLKKAFVIYIKKVEEYTKKFTDSRWSKGETQETIESLLEDIKKRIVEMKN